MPNAVQWTGIGMILAFGAVAIWLRTVSVPPEMHRTAPLPQGGTLQTADGFFAVLSPEDPALAFDRLAGVIAADRSTTRLGGDAAQGHVSYVARTRVLGFPDVVNLWREGDQVAIRGHLMIGRGDLGVNRRRIEAWLARAGL